MQKTILSVSLCAIAALLSNYTHAAAHDNHAHNDIKIQKPDDHGPIGVMREHVHDEGEWMLSYRYSYMLMDGNRDGTSSVSSQEVLNDYMVAPTKMTMQMHMVGAMYGVTDMLTLGVMGGFSTKDMDHVRRNGTTFVMENDGITDTSVNTMYEFYNDGAHRFQLNTGLSLPTGSVDDRKMNGTIFAYPMQMGSGTYDFMPGLSYTGKNDALSWGGQINGTFRLGDNDRGYTLGNRYQLTGWVAKPLDDAFSVSLRLDAQAWEDVNGRDKDLRGPMFMAPPMDADLQAGESVDALIGVNYIVPSGTLRGNRLAAEIGAPLYQRLDGPRLETDVRVIIGWQLAF